jgi:non-canonical purine NTP pyrophosphatase (RdgB/HAM1 family)
VSSARPALYVATKNRGKLGEFRALLGNRGWNVREYGGYAEVQEGENSYADNAARKARGLAGQLRAAGIAAAVVADDSGLEVTALGRRPGVLSARYGGPAATWPQRRRMLLDELAATGSQDRTARFVCALHVVDERGGEHAVVASVDGAIARAERGEGGFSYDALFEYPPLGKTFGELTADEKNAVSHRARAARAILADLGRASRTVGM